jgi:AcrR family transcriptional regulator
MSEPAYTRLQVDERRQQLIDVGSTLFAEHAFEEISMRQIAEAAGISKALLYHYFPSKTELFKAAVQLHATELQRLLDPGQEAADPFQELTARLDAYLTWIEANARTWSKLVQSATTLPEAGTIVATFRAETLERILAALTTNRTPRPALRTSLNGWLGYVDAAILDWIDKRDLKRAQLRDLLIAAFGASVFAAQQLDPKIKLRAGTPPGARAKTM